MEKRHVYWQIVNMYKDEFKNGKEHGWFKYKLNRKFKGKGYAINGRTFFHFVVPEDDGSVECHGLIITLSFPNHLP